MADEKNSWLDNILKSIRIDQTEQNDAENLAAGAITDPDALNDPVPELQSDGLPEDIDSVTFNVRYEAPDRNSSISVEPVWPIGNDVKVSRWYNKDSGGVDFGTGGKTGIAVYAYRSGIVADVVDTPRGKGSGYGGYGKLVIIKHSKNKYSLYSQLDSVVNGLKKGDKVKAGKKIGVAGSTGNAKGTLLHFELRPAPGIGFIPVEKRINPFTKNKNSAKYLK